MTAEDWTPKPVTPGSADPRFAVPECLFFGIGAQKSATTWVASYLGSHPDAHIPNMKELHYWNTVRAPFMGQMFTRVANWRNRRGALGNFARRHLGRAENKARSRTWSLWYQALASGGQPPHSEYADLLLEGWDKSQKAVGEITPAYALLEQQSFADMAALSPNARFFFIMRDPMDRLKSAIRFTIKGTMGRPATEAEFNAVLKQALEHDAGHFFDRSEYLATIDRLEAAVPRDRIAYFFYETLFDQAEVDRLTDFLGIGRRAADFGVVPWRGQCRNPARPRALGARGGASGGTVYGTRKTAWTLAMAVC